MKNILWIIALLAALAGGLTLLGAIASKSAPAQGAMAAIAVGMAIIPYCVARAYCEVGSVGNAVGIERELKELNYRLGTHTGMLAAVANSAVKADAVAVAPSA